MLTQLFDMRVTIGVPARRLQIEALPREGLRVLSSVFLAAHARIACKVLLQYVRLCRLLIGSV